MDLNESISGIQQAIGPLLNKGDSITFDIDVYERNQALYVVDGQFHIRFTIRVNEKADYLQHGEKSASPCPATPCQEEQQATSQEPQN